MNLLDWFASRLSPVRRAEWTYRRGMTHARNNRTALAVADYTKVVQSNDAASEVRAGAYYNRALVFHAIGRTAEAIRDLSAVLEMPGAAGPVRTEARRKLVRIQQEADRAEGQASNVQASGKSAERTA